MYISTTGCTQVCVQQSFAERRLFPNACVAVYLCIYLQLDVHKSMYIQQSFAERRLFPNVCVAVYLRIYLQLGVHKSVYVQQSFAERKLFPNVCVAVYLSSPHAKRVGPMGLRAESARAVTGRRCPNSGRGEDFLMGQQNFFTETAVTLERKIKKSFPRWEINRHVEG